MKQGQGIEVEIFSKQEKTNIRHEFTYDETAGEKSQIIENSDKFLFPEHLLDSTQNSLIKNCTSKSVILAPFNSTKSHIDATLSVSIKELLQTRRCLKMGGRVRDINKQYELNNNADLDNGVYHKVELPVAS